ncbi:MAG: archaetidylserine decarboxylase [Terriglobales bacterium]
MNEPDGSGGWRRAASRLAGRVARAPSSRWLIPWFARHYGIRRQDAVEPAGGYKSLQQFFGRALRPELRPMAAQSEVMICPCDGVVTACGRTGVGQLLQAKGHAYTVAALLGDAVRAPAFAGGLYATIYLAPADYHRVHAPAAARVAEARYLPGARWPVNPRTAERVPQLLARNERLVTYLETGAGELALVMIGACLVGAIRVNYDPGWNAGPGPHLADRRRYRPAVELGRGQELGRFEFGSTVVVLAAPGAAEALCVREGERVLMGAPLMHVAAVAVTVPPATC